MNGGMSVPFVVSLAGLDAGTRIRAMMPHWPVERLLLRRLRRQLP
jgi:hypothetical protein